MQTYHQADVSINYYSSMSGMAHITRRYMVEGVEKWDEIKIPAPVLFGFVADWIRQQKIAQLEEQTDAEMLGLDLSEFQYLETNR